MVAALLLATVFDFSPKHVVSFRFGSPPVRSVLVQPVEQPPTPTYWYWSSPRVYSNRFNCPNGQCYRQ